MKLFHIITISFIILSTTNCTHKMAAVNYEVKDNNGNTTMLLGKSTRQRLAQPPFDSWFIKNYDSYVVDSNTANQLKPLLQHTHLLLFMGTWCGDSRREVPRLYKLLDYCGVPASQVQLVTLNNSDTAYKQSPQHEEKGLNIHRVPDLLIFDKNRELGRVVESPVTSWEKDILAILTQQAYQPHYKAVSYMITVWEQQPVQTVQNNLGKIADTLTSLVANRGELYAYGKILLGMHETDKAVLVMQLNTMLFATDADVWNGLANAWLQKGDNNKAIACYQKARELQPANTTANNMLQKLQTQ